MAAPGGAGTGVVPKPLPKREQKFKPPVKVWEGTSLRIIATYAITTPYVGMGVRKQKISTVLTLEQEKTNTMGESAWVVVKGPHASYTSELMAELAYHSGKLPDSWEVTPPKQRVAMKVDGHPYR